MAPSTDNRQLTTDHRAGTVRKAKHYHARIKGKKADSQCRQVMDYMSRIGQPTTIRNLHKIMNGRGYTIDLVSLRRAVCNLHKPDPKGRWVNPYDRAMLREAFERPCPITEAKVAWYEIIPQQTDLFA